MLSEGVVSWCHVRWYGDLEPDESRSLAWASVDPRAGAVDFRAGSGVCGLCPADLGQTLGRTAGVGDTARPVGSIGSDTPLPQTDTFGSGQSTRCAAWTSRATPSGPNSHRPPRRPHADRLPHLSRAGRRLPLVADASHRRHPRRHPTGGDRTYDSALLVLEVQQARRTSCTRRLAWLANRPARRSAVGLAALLAGHHLVSDYRRVQLPPALQANSGRIGADVAATPGDGVRLVPANSGAGVGFGGVARRRDRLAGQRQDPLAVVLHHAEFDLLPDRSLPRLADVEEVFQTRVCRNVGVRFLGRLQCSRL